jgi:histidinol-phosphate aminotransferase
MTVTRRELLAASALLLGGPGLALRAAGAVSPGGSAGPLVLCWNENPYGPSPAAREAVANSIGEGCRYPSDEELKALTGALAHHEGTSPEQIAIGTGSGELLCALGLLCARDGGELIAAEPTYLELPEYARRAGAVVRFVPVDGELRHDLAAMGNAVSERTRALYLCNPNNPTGTAVPAAQIRAFVASIPPQVTVIVDEAYMDFTTGAGVQSVSDLIEGERRVVILRTFSKIHGMAGLRLGYAVTRPELAKTLRATCMTTPNILAVRAARASLADEAFRADTRRRILASRARITGELTRLNLRYAEPEGNFVFFDTGVPLKTFSQRMKARNILVGRLFPPFSSWCRITIGTEPEVSAFLGALPEAVRA